MDVLIALALPDLHFLSILVNCLASFISIQVSLSADVVNEHGSNMSNIFCESGYKSVYNKQILMSLSMRAKKSSSP